MKKKSNLAYIRKELESWKYDPVAYHITYDVFIQNRLKEVDPDFLDYMERVKSLHKVEFNW